MKRAGLLLFLCAPLYAAALSAQVLPEEKIVPEEYDPSEFPLWAYDIRRFEVVAVGSFPITFFVASLIYDLSLSAANNGSPAYAPGTQRAENDIAVIIGSAAATSVLIAVADLIINVTKRNRQEKTVEKRTGQGPGP